MRVIHVLDHSPPAQSGYVSRTIAILREQRALGWETFHVTSPKHGVSAAGEEDVDGWHFFRTRAPGGLAGRTLVVKELALVAALADRIEEVARRVRPDLLHAHSPALNALAALRAGRRLGLPTVYELRATWEDAAVDNGRTRPNSLRYRASRRLETTALRRADHVVTICDGLHDEVVARGVAPERVTVVPNAVAIDTIAPSADATGASELRRRFGLQGAFVLGFVGSFYPYEGLAVLLRALREITSRLPSTRVLLVGGGPEEGNLRTLASELGVADAVVFAGRVPHAAVPCYYDLMDVVVCPRLSSRLTQLVTPLKPLEAMAHCRPVIASDVGGHRELIRHGQTGVLVTPGDPDALAASVLALAADPGRRAALTACGRHFVERERTWRDAVARCRDVYGALVAGAAR